MKFLENYSDYQPQNNLVDEYLKIISSKYKSKSSPYVPHKYVEVDDRMHYLSGNFKNKGRLIDKIFFDLTYDNEFHKPSLRKAIKIWIDDNSM
jgi:hypothetical protein